MNEQWLRRLFRRVALGSIPWSMVADGAACSDSANPGDGPGQDASHSDVTAATNDAAGDGDVSNADAATDSAQTDSAQTDGATTDGAQTDGPQTDGATTQDPCASFSGFPGCGGGQNFCVVPDAGTAALADGGTFGDACRPYCGTTSVRYSCRIVEVDAAQLVQCSVPCTGRRPAGLIDDGECEGADLATYLSEAARLEAASVAAFVALRRELRHHGAPRSLLRAARIAARDEVRHARMMGALARRHGGAVRRPRVKTAPIRALVDVAIENAVEGCVRETYGALVATYQAHAAGDPALKATMQDIAADETAHAAFAWRVAAWIDGHLTAAEGACVAAARHDAAQAMEREVSRAAPSHSLRQLAGVPAPAEATAMIARLRTELWSA